MTAVQPTTNDRIKSAIATIAIQALLGYALITGLAMKMPGSSDDSLKLFTAAPPSPPPPPDKPPPRVRSKRPEGAASPPNLRAKATEIVAPVPLIRIVPPPPVVVAEKPGVGAAPMTGASAIRGPGTGSGGIGNGTGSGGYGDGDGDGGAGDTPPRWKSGRLKDSDYPSSAGEGGFQGTVSVRFLVAISGHVTECDVTRSSGNVALDETTCRLIEKRYRYEPSHDARGRRVPSMIVESHTWVIEDEPPARGPSS